ncbi:beta-glucosidase family protein [Subtercola lobariae]|uniref:Beta-glucosidase n=1 Tax=Subtercola lobariae TaxID=1588641 RepID=A0A917B8K3_9MICO|nr:glycoside hydrolase family 3 protein [Subtercola lobariae]GGF27523.1 beta-glucosidase [Subtercola lobariae]
MNAFAAVPDNPQAKASAATLRARIETLPLADKVRLLTGETSWTLFAVPELDLSPIVVSDGPIGIRGIEQVSTEAAQMPSPSAVAATWNTDLAARLGTLIAGEARRKGIDVVLAPVVNLQRTPVGGRHFECYSEDPLLTGAIAASYVAAAQVEGVGMSVKHFIGNESETDRTTYIAKVSERVLREVYLAPFETVVREANVWSVMAAYNGVDDGTGVAPATEHDHLLNDVLKREWGFDGVVVSDWLAANSTVESALGGLDLVMPGPGGPWQDKLLQAVHDGLVAESIIDDKVERILRLGERVGAVGRVAHAVPDAPDALHSAPETRALLRETVARSIVVLGNNGILPLDPARAAIGSIALIGPAAVDPFVQGGGSAFVQAPYASTPEAAIRDAFPHARLRVERGGTSRLHAPAIDPAVVTTPGGSPGYELSLFDAHGHPLGDTVVVDAAESWNRDVPIEARSARVRARVRLTRPGPNRLEVGVSGAHEVWFDGELVSASTEVANSNVILNSSANHPVGPAKRFEVGDAEPVTKAIDAELQVVDAEAYGTFVRFELRHEPHDIDLDDELAAAVEAAAEADVAIVLIGTTEETESEGWDRPNLDLPGRQNELVTRVLAVNPRTIVVVNAGAPVLLPWLDDVPAVLWWWLPGQEAGNGLADALTGRVEPSGHLPWTLPARFADVPVQDARPIDGVIDYVEGGDVGYRSWDRLERTPARPFGFGLGYGAWAIPHIAGTTWRPDGSLVVSVEVENRGDRDSRATAQVYLECVEPDPDRPLRWLAGFALLDVHAGQRAVTDIVVPCRQFEVWSEESQQWVVSTAELAIRVGQSSRELSPSRPLPNRDLIHLQTSQ